MPRWVHSQFDHVGCGYATGTSQFLAPAEALQVRRLLSQRPVFLAKFDLSLVLHHQRGRHAGDDNGADDARLQFGHGHELESGEDG